MHLTVDFLTKFLLVVRKDVILIICDKLFKMAYFVVTIGGTSAERSVKLFRNNM